MKKLLLPALLLIVLGGAVAWYALAASLRTEREYTAWIHELAGAGSARVLDSTFERGWLSSRAETSMEVSGGAGLAFRAFVTALGAEDVRERVGLHMVHSIEHGPWPLWEWIDGGMDGAPVLARIRSTVEIDNESQLEMAEAVGRLPPVEAETVLRAGGRATTQLSVAPARLRARGDGFAREARFQGASGQLDLRDGYRHLRGTLESPGLAGRGLERVVELRDVTLELELPGSELPVGRMEIGIGSLQVAPADGSGGFAVEGLTVEPSGRVAGGRLEADVDVRVHSLVVGGERLGPGSLALDLRDLDASAFRRLRRAGLRLQESADPVATAVAAGEVAEALPALLGRGPRAELRDLRLATPAGPVAARGRVGLARPAPGSGPLSLASFFDAELEAEAPVATADAALAALLSPARAAELRTRGALAVDGERARLHAEWRRGVLAVNGVPVPPAPPAPVPAADGAGEPGPDAGGTPPAAEAADSRSPAPAEGAAQDAPAAAEATASGAPAASEAPGSIAASEAATAPASAGEGSAAAPAATSGAGAESAVTPAPAAPAPAP